MSTRDEAKRKRAKALAQIKAIDAELGEDTLSELGISGESDMIDAEVVEVK